MTTPVISTTTKQGSKTTVSSRCQQLKPDLHSCTAPTAYLVEFMYGENGLEATCGKHLGNTIHKVLGANGDSLGAVRVRPLPETD